MAPATQGGTVDWGAVKDMYEGGGNSLRGDGSPRTFAALAAEEGVLANYPNGAQVFGANGFLNELVLAGLDGTGRGQGLGDNPRRQIVDKSLQNITYGKVLQELDAARTRIQDNNLDNNSGAPHNVDEAWAFYVGAPDAEGNLSNSLSATARSREGNFGLDGRLDGPLQTSLSEALVAAQSGDLAVFDREAQEVEGYLNAIFYLATLRYAGQAVSSADEAARATTLAEGWAFFQTIRPAVASASPEAANEINTIFSAPASQAVSSNTTQRVYELLNGQAVIQALRIPQELVVTSPPSS
jgi:hypothetical protein